MTTESTLRRSWVRELDRDWRLRLPGPIQPIEALRVGAVGLHWCELTDDTTRPTLPVALAIRDRRFALGPDAVRRRFGAVVGMPVLLTARGAPGSYDLLVTEAGDGLFELLEIARPGVESLWAAMRWTSPWRPVTGEKEDDYGNR